MDFRELRKAFPVTEGIIFLNNAAESPLYAGVRRRLSEYLDLASKAPQRKPSVRQETKALLAGLLGGSTDDYALVTSTGAGIGIVAAGYDWQSGDNVVVPADEHWNNTFPWLALKARGVDVRLCPMDENLRVAPEAIARLVDSKTRILATAAVRHTTGFRADLKRLSRIAHENGALFLVDGIQAAGVVPIDVEADGIDILACAGFKWLLGLPGTGFLYVNKSAQTKIRPVLPGMFSAEDDLRSLRYFGDARRYETGTIAYSLFHAWAAGLELIRDVGVSAIHERVLELTDRVIEGLRKKNITILSPVERREERSAIISFSAGPPDMNKALVDALAAKNVIISLRDGKCRVSPSFYNDEEDVDRFLEAL